MADAPADWYPDPLGRHEYRYWDGSRWSEHVADSGQTATDPITAEPAGEPTPFGDPQVRAEGGGIRGSLMEGGYTETTDGDRVKLQNSKMLKVTLGAEVLARQGAMVAFQGQVDFDYEGSGGVNKFLKKAMTGEGVPLMRCRGQGEVFLAHDADDIHVLWLDGGGITVNGSNILAFDPSLSWDIERIAGAGMFAGGMFNTVLRGSGWVAITSHGTPVLLHTDAPTFADTDAAIAWSSSLQTSLNRTFKASSLIGRGSGEVAQLAFAGQGFVIVQASEGPTVPPHSHGS